MTADLQSDVPIRTSAEDVLGYDAFAQLLASSILRAPAPEGLVLSVTGPWGSGKTSVLHLIRHHLEESASPRCHFLYLNPWWLPASRDLMAVFFAELNKVLRPRGRTVRKWRGDLAKLAEAISGTPLPHAGWAKTVGRVLRPSVAPMHELKEQVSAHLREWADLIVVIVDDVDRLPSEDVLELFKTVRAVGDLPRVVYLMAFDQDVVESALEKYVPTSGREFLDKVVQLPLHLPLPEPHAIHRLFLARLNDVLADVAASRFDEERWTNLFRAGLAPLLTTPRQVNRTTNSIATAFAALGADVDPVDLVGIEGLRVLLPTAYDTIRASPEFFHGRRGLLDDRWKEDASAFHERWMGQLGDERERRAAQAVLLELFPKLRSVWKNHVFNSNIPPEWMRQGRVAHPDVLPIFFSWRMPQGTYSSRLVLEVLDQAEDWRALAEEFGRLMSTVLPDGTPSLAPFLTALWTQDPDELGASNCEKAFGALADRGDQYCAAQEPQRGMFDMPTPWEVSAILSWALKGVPGTRRVALVDEIIREAAGIGALISWYQWLVMRTEDRAEDEPLPLQELEITDTETEGWAAVLRERIRTAAVSGTLVSQPRLEVLLGFWAKNDGVERVAGWARDVAADQDALTILLLSASGYVRSAPMEGGRVRVARHLKGSILIDLLTDDASLIRLRALSQAPDVPSEAKALSRELLERIEAHGAGRVQADP